MAFPTTSVLDVFTGTNGTDLPVYSANWSVTIGLQGLEIQVNAATTISAGAAINYWNVSNFGPDSEVLLTVTAKGADDSDNGILYRLVQETDITTLDGYLSAVSPQPATDAIAHYRLDNGVATLLGAGIDQEFGAGDGFGAEMIGSTIQAYYKASGGSWVAVGTTRTDATYTAAGKIGIYSNDTTQRLDDFGGGTVVDGAQMFLMTPPRLDGIGRGGRFPGNRVQ